ncbi:MAG: sialidase family protein [Gammaproteobacteria bacterium]
MSGKEEGDLGPAIVSNGFIFTKTPHAMSHASTIAACGDRLIGAWFAGSLESRPDVGISMSLHDGDGWSTPVQVANGTQEDGTRYACWNPVLFQPKTGPLLLFYKVGENPRTWWGMYISSSDGGNTWAQPRALPKGILGPAKNKPVQLGNGDLLSPSSVENDGWRVHLERSSNMHETWERIGPINDGRSVAAIQPSILTHADGRLQLLCRTKHRRIADSWSSDGGNTWSEMRLTSLPNPNSGTDAVSLADGRQLLVYNRSSRRRSPLNIALSRDGKIWQDALVLEQGPGEYSYPAVIQTADGLLHVTYTWNLSRIRHVVIDPAKL